MKKIFLFGLSALAVVLSACNKMDQPAGLTTLTMKAEVAGNEDTKAIFEADGTKFKFNWENNDVVIADKTTNWKKYTENTSFVSFTYSKSDDSFTSSPTTKPSTTEEWIAFYPKSTYSTVYDNSKSKNVTGRYVSLKDQSGDLKDVAKFYAMKGAATIKAGETYMKFKMNPAVAVIKINTAKSDNVYLRCGSSNIQTDGLMLKTGETDWSTVGGTNSVLTLKSTGGIIKTYYLVVPAATKITLKNGTATTIKESKSTGLQAGKYYEITY